MKRISRMIKKARRKASSETWLKKSVFRFQSWISAWFVRLLGGTLKFTAHNMPGPEEHCVFAFWHRNLLILMIQRLNSGIAVLVSTSDAGRLVAGPVARLGYVPVRGSSTRKGSRALKQLILLSRERSIAITPDGPSGPRGSIQQGVFQLAWLAKVPIVPVTVDCEKEWVFRSWDRFRLPKPFSRIQVHYGNPIYVNDKEDFPLLEEKLRALLTDIGK